MPLFVLHCIDAPGAAETRARLRDEHLAHVRGTGRTRIAGPMLNDEGGPAGSLLIIEADSLEDAQAFSRADPYARGGVFQSVDVRPFRMTLVALEADGPA